MPLPEPKQPLIEGVDYVMEGPYLVFTAAYHLKRGYCCGNQCRNCPWRNGESAEAQHPDR